jgi:hypothetical protein
VHLVKLRGNAIAVLPVLPDHLKTTAPPQHVVVRSRFGMKPKKQKKQKK